MEAKPLTFPVDMTPALYEALHTAVASMNRLIGLSGGTDTDRAALARAIALVEEIEALG